VIDRGAAHDGSLLLRTAVFAIVTKALNM